jgi:hypothetical protein
MDSISLLHTFGGIVAQGKSTKSEIRSSVIWEMSVKWHPFRFNTQSVSKRLGEGHAFNPTIFLIAVAPQIAHAKHSYVVQQWPEDMAKVPCSVQKEPQRDMD